MKIPEVLQQVQDAFANQLEMTVFVTDIFGRASTSFSYITPAFDMMIQKMIFNFKEKVMDHKEALEKLTRPTVIDTCVFSNYVGIKMIVAPIQIDNKVSHLIWAGFIIEEGYKVLVQQELSQGETTLNNLKEESFLEIEEKLKTIEKMSSVYQELLVARNEKQLISSAFEKLFDLLSNNSTPLMRRLLSLLLEIDLNIDFIAYSRGDGRNNFKVIYTEGQFKEELQSLSFTIEQLQFQEGFRNGQLHIWSNLNNSLEPVFFPVVPTRPKIVFCFPLVLNERVEGVVLGGSLHSESLSFRFTTFCKMLSSILVSHLQIEHYQKSLDRHLMRMSSLLEMSKAMNMVTKREDVLYMLVDIVQELVPGDFSVVSLENGLEVCKIKNTKISQEELAKYHEQAIEACLCHLSEAFKGPKLVTTKWGDVLEYPFYKGNQLVGVLSTHLTCPSSIKEAEVFVATLTNSATEALKHIEEIENKGGERTISIEHQNPSFIETLTPRELDVLLLLAKGDSNREISEKLFISVHTVKNHITNIFQKLGVSDRSQLIARVYQLYFNK